MTMPSRKRGYVAGVMQKSDLSKQNYETLAAFRHLLRRFAAFSEAEARAAGLTAQQHQALLAIKGTPGRDALGVNDIAAHLLIRHNTAVELVDRLADAQWVRRLPDPADGRRTLVALTERAERVLRDLAVTHQRELRAIRSTLLTLLKQV
jgi:DNA-binding MarR family transcriptional regulator